MIILNNMTESWLKHRLGEIIEEGSLPQELREAIELDKHGINYLKTRGKQTIKGYIGFIDLKGFSSITHMKPAADIAAYVKPFLSSIMNIISDSLGIIDKSIGDEIMFIIPEYEEENSPCSLILFVTALIGLKNYALSQDIHYKFRISSSYGELYLDRINSKSFSEWTFYGECIHVAKRVANVIPMRNSDNIRLAFGMTFTPDFSSVYFKNIRMIKEYRHEWNIANTKTKRLKGVGKVRYSIFNPNKKLHF